MKICVFAKYLPVHITGGMEIHIQDLVNGLVKRGHKVTIITAPHPKGIKKEQKGNLTIYYLKHKPKYTREKFYRESAKLFEKLNEKEKFDIVHSQSGIGLGYLKYCKKTIPIVMTFHGTSLDEIKSSWNVVFSKTNIVSKIKSLLAIFKQFIAYIQFLPYVKKFKGVISTSNEQTKIIKKWYFVPEEKIYKIFNGVDTERFKPDSNNSVREKYNLEKEKIILVVSILRTQKGIQNIIRAMPKILERIKNIKLMIVGEGNYRQELKRLVDFYNLKKDIIFTGTVPFENLPGYFNFCDVFVNPTIRQNGYDLTIIEAMACQKPVVVSNIGSVPTVIENNINGILVSPGDIDTLSSKVIRILNNKELAVRLAKMARETIIKNFSLNKMVDETIKVYKNIINK